MAYICLLTLWFVVLFSGCTVFNTARKVSQEVHDVHTQSSAFIKDLQQTQRNRVTVHEEPWISKRAIKLDSGRLPQAVNSDVTFATGTQMSFNEFSKLINKLCGISLRITPDAEAKLNGEMRRSKGDQQGSEKQLERVQKISGIRWQGKLDGLLDVVASSLGISWKFSHGMISFYYLDSRTFQIYAIPSETEMRSVVQSGIHAGISAQSEKGSSGRGDGQSSQTTSVSLKSAMLQDICRSVESMLTPELGRLSASYATGTITVTDTPETLNRIQAYIEHENRSITKQVLLNVKVLAVDLYDRDQMDLNWNLIYQTGRVQSVLGQTAHAMGEVARQGGAVGTEAVEGVAVNAARAKRSFKGPIIMGGYNNSIGIIDDKQFDGSALFLNALAKQGKVSIITSPSVTTLNLQPAPVQVATQTSYLARIESSSTANVGTSTSLMPGTITSGFNMNLLPFVMSDNQLLLQYSINMSELQRLETIDGGNGNRIQVPEVNNRIFSQKVKMRSGQTLVLSGFEQMKRGIERRGTGAAGNWTLGGGVSTNNKRTTIVILITPVVLE